MQLKTFITFLKMKYSQVTILSFKLYNNLFLQVFLPLKSLQNNCCIFLCCKIYPCCLFILYIVCAKSLQLCTTLHNPMGCNLPGSSVQEILQAKIMEWVAMPFFKGISLTQGSNPHLVWLPHCRQIVYHWATRKDLTHSSLCLIIPSCCLAFPLPFPFLVLTICSLYLGGSVLLYTSLNYFLDFV